VGTGHCTQIHTHLEDVSPQQQCHLIQQRAHTCERAGGFILLSVLALTWLATPREEHSNVGLPTGHSMQQPAPVV